ncbi:cell division protein FtsQ/DivIB [Pectinatus sottacetonis]|uniref:cell division protein FtsQ/DivIB n=1 Tax=Pectinatus sottacetonis TaxID=1002795 RepID=UPI0018C7E341|nr:FtsQ-type POTRA domain-containing protein [Pectinatus sottacetonis]
MRKRISRRYVIKGVLLILLLSGLIFFIKSPLLAVSNIVVEGNSFLNKDQICNIAGIGEPLNIFNIHTDLLQNRLEQDLRIKKAAVRRIFPNTLLIKIEERQPWAILHCDFGYVDISADGVILDAYKNLKTMKYPMITGPILHDVYIGDKINDTNILRAVSYLAAMDDTARVQISEINLSMDKQIVAYTNTGVQIRLGDLSAPVQKAARTMTFLRDLKGIKRPIKYVDFSYAAPVFKFKS